MKKCLVMTILATMAMMLTGCSADSIKNNYEKYIQKRAVEQSDIQKDEDYVKYITWKENGELVEYISTETEESSLDENKNKVHITFAINSFLEVEYYYDAALTNKVDITNCYIAPGESIYASQPICANPYSSNYKFREFRVIAYDSDGNRSSELETSGENGCVLTVPDEYADKELSVEPIGEYEVRTLSFYSYIKGADGEEQEVYSTWEINDEEYTGNTAEINPSDSYTVKCNYDKDTYYYVDSEPECYSYAKDGVVSFKEISSLDDTENYKVELRQYITANFEGNFKEKNAKCSIWKNGEEVSLTENNTLNKLKCGDQLIIETNDNYRLFCEQISLAAPETLNDGRLRYTVEVSDTDDIALNFKVGKSRLEVIVKEDVGTDILFDINTSERSVRNKCYENSKKVFGVGELFNTKTSIFDETIGIEDNITLIAHDGLLETGEALKLSIKKVDGNGKKYEEVRYIDKLPGEQEVKIYEDTDIKNFLKIYESVTIEISKVDVVIYEKKTVENGTVKLYYADTTGKEEVVEDGSVIEASRKVKFEIRSNSGYVVTGDDLVDGVYSDTMKYSKYAKKIDDILEKHKIVSE